MPGNHSNMIRGARRVIPTALQCFGENPAIVRKRQFTFLINFSDYEAMLRLEPGNKQAKTDLDNLEKVKYECVS